VLSPSPLECVAQEGCRKGDNLHFFFSGNRVLLCTLGWSLTHDCPASASLVCAGITAVCHTQLEFKDLFLNFNLFSTNGKGVFVLLCVVVTTKCDLCGCKGNQHISDKGPLGSCFKCGKEGHWAKACPNPTPPSWPCQRCHACGHWAIDCPSSWWGVRQSSCSSPDFIGLATDD
jgi:hypothetical protein